MSDKNSLKIANLGKQIQILIWKNFISIRRNKVGTFVELICPLILASFLLVIRHFVNRIEFSANSMFNIPMNVFDLTGDFNSKTRNYVIYYPNNPFIRGLVNNAIQLIAIRNPNFSPLYPLTIRRTIVFYSFPTNYTNSLPENVEYTIYSQEDQVFRYKVDSIFPSRTEFLYSNGPENYCNDQSFFSLYNTFNTFKFAMDIQIINNLTNLAINNSNLLNVMSFNCPDYVLDQMKSVFGFFTPLLISVSFMFTALITIGNIVVEKSTKLKEYLKLIGLKWYAMWFTWWIRSLAVYTIVTIYIVIITRIIFAADTSRNPFVIEKSILVNTNFFVFFIFLLAYSVQVSTFTILLAQLFSKAFSARVFLVIVWLFSVINFYDELPSSVYKYIFCFFPNLGLNFGIQIIFQYERSGETFTISNLYENLFDDPLNLGAIMSAMIIWSIFYLPLTWYLEKINPGDYGVPLPYYFPITVSYWFPQSLKIKPNEQKVDKNSGPNFEREPSQFNLSVKVFNLSKKFSSLRRKKLAVNNVSLNFYENQVTGLLGHNGAGKTTLTFMLSGLYPPTTGSATIMGFDLRNDLDKIRSIMGYCPQVDILIDSFNVKEHLKLIAMIKGYPKEKLEGEIERISKFVGLNKDLYKKAKNLSGGMKRRLMVAMALIGDSKIIILDEPTSGLDPFNRVKLWELIRKYKTGRTIILTTHFMEEADALSDRIAIMNHGEIKCCGSPIFLKNRYGAGFQIKIMKQQADFDLNEFQNLLNNFLNDYKIETNIAAEITISVPFEKMKMLPNLLNEIEINKEYLKIDSYSISSSTIEEVFLKVGKIDQKESNESNDIGNVENTDEAYFNAFKQQTELKAGLKLHMQQITCLFIKRLIIFYRRFILAIVTLFLPIFFQGLLAYFIPPSSIFVNNQEDKTRTYGSLELDLTRYGSQDLTYYINNQDPGNSFNQLLDKYFTYSNRPGINLNRVNGSVLKYVSDKHKENLNTLIGKYFVGLNLNVRSSPSQINTFEITAFYSRLAYHSIAFIVHEISNLLLAYGNSNKLNKRIATTNTPLLPYSSKYEGMDFTKYIGCFDLLPSSLFNFSTSIIIGFMVSIVVMHVSREKVNGSKKLQLLSNTHVLTYWISNYLFDFFLCLLNIVLVILILVIINAIRNDESTDTYLVATLPTVGYLFFVLLISCFSWPLYCYCWSHFFKSDITSFVVLLVLLGMASLIEMLFFFIQIFIHINDVSLMFDSSGSLLMYSLRIILSFLFPNITIKRELFNFRIRSNAYCIDSLNRLLKINLKYDATFLDISEPGVGIFLLISLSQFVLWLLTLIALESGALSKESLKNFKNSLFKRNLSYISLNKIIESNVQKEIKRITTSDLQHLAYKEPLIVSEVLKLFKKSKTLVAAVDGISFGVKQQTCFGLLGLNGAGKTTSFKMIVGELSPTRGDVLINGFSIQKDRYEARKNLGYCPQFDCLPEYLTVKEAIYLFAQLRGIPFKQAKQISIDMLDIFRLNEFEKTLVQNLSGGNKRKVSCAIAFIGKPSVVILDEPSTGMDPGARKFLWKIIKKARDLGITIVLSSHSMEECEALCDKLSIMLDGQLQCFDSIPMLKRKFGDGLRLIIKCKHNEYNNYEIINNLENFINVNFPTAVLEDKQYETLFYNIKSSNSSRFDKTTAEYSTVASVNQTENLSYIFSIIEENKEALNIESYHLSQTTLEQVFMTFANSSTKKDLSKTSSSSSKDSMKKLTSLFSISEKLFNTDSFKSGVTNKQSPSDAFLISYKPIGQPANKTFKSNRFKKFKVRSKDDIYVKDSRNDTDKKDEFYF